MIITHWDILLIIPFLRRYPYYIILISYPINRRYCRFVSWCQIVLGVVVMFHGALTFEMFVLVVHSTLLN